MLGVTPLGMATLKGTETELPSTTFDEPDVNPTFGISSSSPQFVNVRSATITLTVDKKYFIKGFFVVRRK
jgi:hypothetical protein